MKEQTIFSLWKWLKKWVLATYILKIKGNQLLFFLFWTIFLKISSIKSTILRLEKVENTLMQGIIIGSIQLNSWFTKVIRAIFLYLKMDYFWKSIQLWRLWEMNLLLKLSIEFTVIIVVFLKWKKDLWLKNNWWTNRLWQTMAKTITMLLIPFFSRLLLIHTLSLMENRQNH